ncbi:acetyl-CoA synthetase-like protein [Aspergillus avenaceus]|uniref:Acetyl-CoA synthetase-like protein n=1 Tax=Aspergillus avenaceus TaxID=36643 RepID=A0A5N6TM79_ASPAV|nr:acetyl-CoA synthetase-like protein [Aspergillus avenaceus]
MAGSSSPSLSLVHGPLESPLCYLTLGQLVDQQSDRYGSKEALIVPWSGARLSFYDLSQRTQELARGLLAIGVRKGDRIAIFSSDDERFAELFLAVARIGAILVILNKTYTILECDRAIRHTDASMLFLGDMVNRTATVTLIQHLQIHPIPGLKNIILMRTEHVEATWTLTWNDVLCAGASVAKKMLDQVQQEVRCHDTVNFQFTSGTTGAPKAVMLSHFGIINNGRICGYHLNMTPEDTVCCPPPMFHAFGLVCGLICSLAVGSAVIYPSRDFDAHTIVDALIQERCTVLHGVPTMIVVMLQQLQERGQQIETVRTGMLGGMKVPSAMVSEMKERFPRMEVTIVYGQFHAATPPFQRFTIDLALGMTETSAACFITSESDTTVQKLETVGKVLPHVWAKIVDSQGHLLPVECRGELCVSGVMVQKGYYKDKKKTDAAMVWDEEGMLWLHTGDEATIDAEGYCRITGRIKDIIIRGGENIYPTEIEERLMEHPVIEQAAVVGLKDDVYGEVVAAFLQSLPLQVRPSLNEVKGWVRQAFGRHKAPAHVFWVGPEDLIHEYPATGSGKIRKDALRKMGNMMLDT